MNSTWLDDDEWTGGERRPADRSPGDPPPPAPGQQQTSAGPLTGATEPGAADRGHDATAGPAGQTVSARRASDGGAWEAAPWAPAPGAIPPLTTPASTGHPAPGQTQGWAPPPRWGEEPQQQSEDVWSSTGGPTVAWGAGQPGGTTSEPPSTEPERSSPRGSLRSILAAALVAALVAAGVTVPLTLALVPDPEPATADAGTSTVSLPAPAPGPEDNSDTPADETPVAPPAPTAGMTTDTVADVAEALLPSVAVVETDTGAGSAVVYRADGYLVTNNHVIEGARQVLVRLPDGRTRQAEVIGTASSFDLAVLQIDATDLTVPSYASEDPRVGETAIAIGAPFGFDSTVTSGIVSALGRQLVDPLSQTQLVDLVQTDAAINPGNSGGALVNAAGQVIGINTAIVGGGTNDGVGFAVPTSTVLRVAEQLIEQGFFEYALLGVTGGDVLPDQADDRGLDTTNGAFIREVVPDSAADNAGVAAGDIIVSLDGEPINSMSDLSAAIRGYGPDDVVTLEVIRPDGTREELEATLGGVRTND